MLSFRAAEDVQGKGGRCQACLSNLEAPVLGEAQDEELQPKALQMFGHVLDADKCQ